MKNLFPDIVPSSLTKCEETKSLPTMSKFSPQNCAFYLIEIRRTVLKQPIRIEYLIKQKPRGALTLLVNRIADRKKSLTEEVDTFHSFFII